MRITFENAIPGQTVEHSKTNTQVNNEKITSKQSLTSVKSSFAMPTEYEGKGKTKEDIAMQADSMDTANMHNAMAVMSNTMSENDFNKACEDGIDMSEISVEDSVTILDKIKLEVARSGESIPGFTDTLGKEELLEMTGRYDITVSDEMMNKIDAAYEKISDVTEMTDEMIKFFLSSGNDLSIENLFVAKHSVSQTQNNNSGMYFTLDNSSYLAVKSQQEVGEEINGQVENLLADLEIESSEENVESSKWLIKNSFEINPSSIDMVKRSRNLALPLTEEAFAKAVCIAISEGKEPKDAIVDKTENIYEEALRVSEELVHARRVLEEVRLSMTTEANLILIKSGFSIDTKDMEEYVDALKKLEDSLTLGEVETINKVNETIEDIKAAPAALVEYVSRIPHVSLDELRNEGNKIKTDYEAAALTYEAVGTQVRRDLGDSIKKAFRNVDDLIKETGLEVNDITRRATRILGYNNMEITRENINKIADADSKLQAVLDKLSPKDTIDLIRRGSSPIEMSIDELSEYINDKETSQEKEMEKYSKYLYKLEKNDAITPEERESYIEVYRLLHAIKKGDYAAIGAIVNAGLELTFSNLKQAVSSRKHAGMDIKVDKTYGLLVDKLEDVISPEGLKAVSFDESNTLSALYDDITKVPVDHELEKAYMKEEYRLYKEAMNQPEEVVNELVNNGEIVSENTLLAAAELMKRSAKTLRKLDEVEEGKLPEAGEKISESMEDKESAQKAVEEVTGMLKEKVFEAAMQEDTYIDVRELSLIHKEMTLVRNYSYNEYYKLPVEIDGELTLANVMFVHNSENEPGVVFSLDSEKLGHVSSRFTLVDNKISGYLATNLKEAVEKLTKVSDKISDKLSVVYSKDCDSDKVLSQIPMKDNNEVSTAELYKATQTFIKAFAKIEA